MSRLKHLRTRRLAVIGAATLASGLASIGSVSAAAPRAGAAAVTKTFSFVGHEQFFHVPAGITLVTIEALGAQGGSSTEAGDSPVGVAGGKGGMATATIPVTTGEELTVFVGGQPARVLDAPGGFNGGGASRHGMTPRPSPDCGHTDQPPCPHGGNGGGGGGASDVRVGGDSLARRVVVAGGGGGGGGDIGKCVGGAGGGVVGDPGSPCRNFQGGGGTQNTGGSAGMLNGNPGARVRVAREVATRHSRSSAVPAEEADGTEVAEAAVAITRKLAAAVEVGPATFPPPTPARGCRTACTTAMGG